MNGAAREPKRQHPELGGHPLPGRGGDRHDVVLAWPERLRQLGSDQADTAWEVRPVDLRSSQRLAIESGLDGLAGAGHRGTADVDVQPAHRLPGRHVVDGGPWVLVGDAHRERSAVLQRARHGGAVAFGPAAEAAGRLAARAGLHQHRADAVPHDPSGVPAALGEVDEAVLDGLAVVE